MGDDAIEISWRKVLIDILLINAVGWPVHFIDLYGTPYQRGVFCNDQTLMYPYKSSTVAFPYLISIGFLLPLFVMLLTEFLQRSKDPKTYSIFGINIPNWFYNFYCHYGIFCYGEATNHVMTDSAKFIVGRLRPYFLTECEPDMCKIYPNGFFEKFKCTKIKYNNAAKTRDMRLSFPSGHSSCAMYCALYFAIYLQARMTWEGSKLLRPVFQTGVVFAALATALSRISDNKHHWSDILVGLLLGATVAIVFSKYISRLFVKEKDLIIV